MDQYKIFNNKVHEKQIVGYFRIMVAPMDPKPLQQISPKIEEWFKSEEGQWVQSYCKDLNSIKLAIIVSNLLTFRELIIKFLFGNLFQKNLRIIYEKII